MKHLIAFCITLCLLTSSQSASGKVQAQQSTETRIHPVILIHGINDVASNCDATSGPLFFSSLVKDGYNLRFVTTFAYTDKQRFSEMEDDDVTDKTEDSYQDISKVAKYLKSEIDFLYEKSGQAKIDIVAHSLGGIVTREYLRQNPNDHKICRFIDLATPHSGSSYVSYINALSSVPKELRPSIFDMQISIAEQFGYQTPDKDAPSWRQLDSLDKGGFLATLNVTPSDKTVQYWMLYGDIKFQINVDLFGLKITPPPVSVGDLVVSSQNASTIPDLASKQSSSSSNVYNTKPFESPNKVELMANIQINLKEWKVKLDAKQEVSIGKNELYWHNGLLRNPEVDREILSILNKNYVPDCAPAWPVEPTPTATATIPVTATFAPTPTNMPTDTHEPVSSLNGMVTQQSSCRYGPSQYHLYKTGFKSQAPVKIIGRDADGDWLQIELSGGNTPCWINTSLVQVEGDVMALPDTYLPERRLPISDAFPQIALISASPGANGVTASWAHFEIREDLKQTDTVEYVIEVWTCVNGKPAFYAVGTDDTVASFQIDNSCGIAPYAHLIGQDEHGFSFPARIPLP